jgi:dTMP kinase
MLISFCGIDGSGKSTQIALLQKHLKAKWGDEGVVLRQPTPWYRSHPKVQRRIEMNDSGVDLRFLSLYSAADRIEQQVDVIAPLLAAGRIVIMDRYLYSALAYMSARGLDDVPWLESINKFAMRPHLPIYIRMDPELALRRVIARDGKSVKREEQDLLLMSKVAHRFDEIAARHGLLVVEGEGDIVEVHLSIANEFEIRRVSM